MKNYLYKNVFKCLAVAFLLTIASQSFAISFNESRRVVIPRFTNAVYRDLTVLDTMSLKTDETSFPSNQNFYHFLIEIGKRPGYFWSQNMRYYLYQNQELIIKDTKYSIRNGEEYGDFSDGDPRIKNMILGEGTFFSENMDFSWVFLNRDSSLIVKFPKPFESKIDMSEQIRNWDVFAQKFSYRNSLLTENNTKVTYHIDNLYLRDVNFNGVIFPSPRLMVYSNGTGYKAIGTSTEFITHQIPSAAPKNYYGNWLLVNDGAISSSQDNVCGTPEDRCDKVVGGRGVPDTDTETFECVGKTDSQDPNNYDPNYGGRNYCYDYNAVKISGDLQAAKNLPYRFNNNQSYFEFKVEEIFQMYDNTSGSSVTLISQSPRTRVLTMVNDNLEGQVIIPITTYSSTTETWTAYVAPEANQANIRVYVDGVQKEVANIDNLKEYGEFNYLYATNPCFYLCDGKLCTENKAYIKEIQMRELKGGESAPINSLWVQEEGPKQHLVIRTYTMGFCPKSTISGQQNMYESNYNYSYQGDLIEGRLISDGAGGWTTEGYVCVKRKVKCNSLSGPAPQVVNYKPLSTDY